MTRQHTTRILFALIVVIGMTVGIINSAQATPGDLDTTFDSDGIVSTSLGGYPAIFYDVIVQPDNKIIALGGKDEDTDWANPYDFIMVRYMPDGSLDSTFASGGIYIANPSLNDDRLYAAALQSDGKIIAVGRSVNGGNHAFYVARYDTNGNLDTTFGSAGVTHSSFGAGADMAYDVAIQEDGKIVVVGSVEATNFSYLYDFVIARYTDTGILDTTFNTTGYVIVTLQSEARDYAKYVAIQPDGKIVAAGPVETGNVSNMYNVATIRLTSAGALDTDFNGTGIASYYGSGNVDNLGGLDIQNDGKIVVASGISGSNIGVVRYTSTGTVDTTFSSADFGNSETVKDATLQPDGKLVVVGSKWDASNSYDPFVVRYNTDGTLDTTFGSGGLQSTIIGTDTDFGDAVAIQPDGQIVVAGYQKSGGNAALVLRYDTRVIGTATVGTSETSIGSTNVSAQVTSDSCEVTAIKKITFPGRSADAGEMPIVWNITGSGCAFPATLKLCYTDAELANARSVTESNLGVFKYNDGSGTWESQGGTVNTATNCVTLSGVNELSDWTIGDITTSGNSGPTAIKLEMYNGHSKKVIPWLLVGCTGLLAMGFLSKRLKQAR